MSNNVDEKKNINVLKDNIIEYIYLCKDTCRRRENLLMTDKVIENNQVTKMGEISGGFTFSHAIYGEGFYTVDLKVKRLSDSYDVIPMMVSERLVNVNQDMTGTFCCVSGLFRSYNRL